MVGHGPQMTPSEPAAERESFGGVLPEGRLRAAIRRLNPAISFRTPASLRDTLLPTLLNGGGPRMQTGGRVKARPSSIPTGL